MPIFFRSECVEVDASKRAILLAGGEDAAVHKQSDKVIFGAQKCQYSAVFYDGFSAIPKSRQLAEPLDLLGGNGLADYHFKHDRFLTVHLEWTLASHRIFDVEIELLQIFFMLFGNTCHDYSSFR